MAAFDNSHHDMRSYVAQKEGCFHCHGRNSASAGSVLDNQVGTTGALCLARCHSGAGILGSNNQLTPTAPPSVNTATYAITPGTMDFVITYFSNGHGKTRTNLTNPVFSGAATQANYWTGAASTWPYVTASTNLECTSCHAVHDNQNGPFLWAPLAPGTANGTDGFCDRCHFEAGRRGDISAAPAGNHPVNLTVDNVTAAGRSTNGRLGRRILIQAYSATRIFDVVNPAPNTLLNGTSAATAWNTGGHLITPGTSAAQAAAAMTAWTPTGGTQVMGCFTCHSPHRTNQQGENNLTVVEAINTGGTAGTWNPMCVGCHGNATTQALDADEWMVGEDTAFGHPVGANTGTPYVSSVGDFPFAIATPTYTNPEVNQIGTGGTILCTSCHKVHGGQATSMAIANLGQTGSRVVCKQCHTGVGIPNLNDFSKGGAVATGHNALNTHHVTMASGLVTPPATLANQTSESTSGYPNALYINQPSWYSSTTGIGDLALGMDCADCHVFNGTAHNW
jgi:Zn-finger protein